MFNELFKSTSSDWVKYSNYEIKESGGRKWITPAPDSIPMLYQPVHKPDTLVQDALNLGRLFCMKGYPDEYAELTLLGYCITYGLLGLMNALPLNSTYLLQKQTYLGIDCPYFDKEIMKTDDYVKFFVPFGGSKEKHIGNAIPGSYPLRGWRDANFEIAFARSYAEPLDWIFDTFKRLYTHFSACKRIGQTDNPATRRKYEEIINDFPVSGLAFQMRMYAKPSIHWEFNSLKTAIETLYSIYMSTEDTLRMCKQCNRAFCAKHGRSEFCEDKCRNQHNVARFREREKQKQFEETMKKRDDMSGE
jgi:hypothetical protein